MGYSLIDAEAPIPFHIEEYLLSTMNVVLQYEEDHYYFENKSDFWLNMFIMLRDHPLEDMTVTRQEMFCYLSNYLCDFNSKFPDTLPDAFYDNRALHKANDRVNRNRRFFHDFVRHSYFVLISESVRNIHERGEPDSEHEEDAESFITQETESLSSEDQ